LFRSFNRLRAFTVASALVFAGMRLNGVWNAAAKIKAIDFAGGTVVHMSSGWSALILCLMLGKRQGFGQIMMAPHSLALTMVGTGMLWVGWYGFNAGSAVAADGIAANAFMTTTLSAAVAGFTWPLLEWITRGKPTVLGFCSGIVAGLVVITPAAGFVNASGAVLIGVLAGVVPFLACTKLKNMFNYDDSLDTFGVHGVGGTLGALLTGVFASKDINGLIGGTFKDSAGNAVDLSGGGSQFMNQLIATGITWVIAGVGCFIILKIVNAVVGLRPKPEEETQGLDLTLHGESAYNNL